MSVRFEKETVRNAPVPGQRQEDVAHKIGERLTGGKSNTGYLAVRVIYNPAIKLFLTFNPRHICNNYSQILCAPRCLHPDHLRHYKKCWLHG